MKKLIGITSAGLALFALAFACSASGPVPAQAPASPATPAPAPQVVKQSEVPPTPYKGREGAAALLEAMACNTLPKGGAALVATPSERFEGSLDFSATRTASQADQAAIGLVAAIDAGRTLPQDMAPAAAATVVATHNAWVVTAGGLETQEVPEWTSVVMKRAAGGDAGGTESAIALQLSSERRIDSIKNPGFFGTLAWWWSR